MTTCDSLRIAMLSLHSCPVGRLGTRDTGGMSVYVRELAIELGRQGHRVDIFTRAHDPEDPDVMELAPGVRLIHLRVGEVEQLPKLVLYANLEEAACSLERFRTGEETKYDLVHSHYWLSAWAGRRVSGWWNVPHVTMFHTLAAAKNETGMGEEEPELRVVTEADLASDCDLVIAPTEREKADLIRHYGAHPDAVAVVPCGVNLVQFRPLPRQEARRHLGLDGQTIILYVGRVDPLKGLDRLLTALPGLPGASLIVVGGDDDNSGELERLKGLSEKLGLDGAVEFAGTADHEVLPYYYSAADVFALPSYYESFGLAALESLACGTPVVGNNVGGVGDVIRDEGTGCVTPNNMPDALAEGLAAVLRRPPFDPYNVRASVLDMGWSNVADAVIRQYRTVLSARQRPES